MVNRVRLVLGVVLLSITNWFLTGSPLPVDAGLRPWFWFGLSGLVGLTLGDSLLFQSFLEIGPRKAILVMSSWPIFSAIIALLFLGERLSLPEDAGIALTVAGIGWVVLEGGSTSTAQTHPHLMRGVLFALGGGFCQAIGIVLAKKGLDGRVSPLSGTLIRMIVATLGIWGAIILVKGVKNSIKDILDRKAFFYTTLGAITGPFLGVWMSLVAVQHAKVGIASALMALMPVMMLPLSRVFFKERLTRRSLLGTFASFAGVVILFIQT